MINIDFSNIRLVNGSLHDGFEELVCQLARKEVIPDSKNFKRNGRPDGGVECYWELQNGDIIAWQAKYFCKAFEKSQYQQITNSIRRAIESYPKIRRYIIAVPIDSPNACVPGRESMRQRVDEFLAEISENFPYVAFEFWWASDLISRLQRPTNQGLTRFWFDTHELTDSEVVSFNDTSIKDLGTRYTPKLNVEVEETKYLEILARGNTFANLFEEHLNNLEIICKRIKFAETLTDVQEVQNEIEIIKRCDISGVERLPLNKLLENLQILLISLNNAAKRISENDSKELKEVKSRETEISEVYNILQRDEYRLINNPILILEGDAGVGKSHMIADYVSKSQKENQLCLLFLGQKFITDEDPFTQMKGQLSFTGTSDELLEMLEAKAMAQKKRFVLYIDAINEGHGLNMWPNNIRSFIDKIRHYPWLGLVLSIRTTYKAAILPDDEFWEEYCVRATLRGFGINTQKAVKLYFKEYGIFYPSVPILNPEFKIPLFLYLFCEGLKKNGYTSIPDGIIGISAIVNLFFEGIDKSIRSKKRHSKYVNVAFEAANKYIEYTTENKCHEISTGKAVKLFSDICPQTFAEGELLDILVSEGLFGEYIFRTADCGYERYIYYSYERFENILQAKSIIGKMKPGDRDLVKYLPPFKYLFQIEGLLEALAIMLPEEKGMELYDSIREFSQDDAVIEAVLYSIAWRKETTIEAHLDKYFLRFVDNGPFMEQFAEVLFQVSLNPGNYFNANYLHNRLSSMCMTDRDAVWIPLLFRIYGREDNIIKEVVNWIWEDIDKVKMDDKTAELASTLLSWFLASTNRELRDTATKALVQLLHNRMPLLISLLKKFTTVDDPYIMERLYCVALGCAVRTESKTDLKELCNYVYETIFNVNGEVYPHALLRDYARGVIEYALFIGETLNIKAEKIRPPYKSEFNYDYVSDDEINAMLESCGGYDKSPGMCSLIRSMLPEHNSVLFSYGDFGRYTFQRAMSYWTIDPESLNNVAVKLILDKYGYSEEKHGAFDRIIGCGRGRTTIPNERIGKKYQWLALHELLARVADNFDMKDSEGPFIRDIDPTFLNNVKKLQTTNEYTEKFSDTKDLYDKRNFEMNEWLARKDDLPSAAPIISLKDSEGCEWIALECYPEWEEPHSKGDIYKILWYQIRSLIVDEEDFPIVYEWAKKQDFGGRWMPECQEIYNLFYREYYWSPEFERLEKEGLTRRRIIDPISKDVIANAEWTTITYIWEAEGDSTKELPIRSLLPSKELFDGMNMPFADEEGKFHDVNGNIVCFDSGIDGKSSNMLLIRKDALIEYLEKYHKKIIWYVLGEKNVVGIYRNIPNSDFPWWLNISGIYTLGDESKVIGQLTSFNQ